MLLIIFKLLTGSKGNVKLITLSIDVCESKNYANLYRAWYSLNRFYLSKKSDNAKTKYFFSFYDSNYQKDFSVFYSPDYWFRYCSHFRDFVRHLSGKGFALASLYFQLKKEFRAVVIHWQFYDSSLGDQDLLFQIRCGFHPLTVFRSLPNW